MEELYKRPFWYFSVLKTDLERKSSNEYILRSDIGGSNIEKFKELMNDVDWNLITQTLNRNGSTVFLLKIL